MAKRRPRTRSGPATIGLIVEGDTEYGALPRLHTKKLLTGCPPLRPINLGGIGEHITPEGLAKRLAPKVIAHMEAGRQRVVICFDRENRLECVPQLALLVSAALSRELHARRRNSADVSVVVLDRSFEAWLLADARGLRSKGLFTQDPTFHSFEGESGAQGKKGSVELTRLLAREYVKTRDGPTLFEAMDFATARQHGPGARGSRSLDKFLRSLGL